MHAPADGGPVTIPDLLARNVARHGAKPAYREKEFGIWQSWTWAQASEQIDALAMGLLTLGANVGDHVAVSGRNRPALYWAMVAAQRIGCIPVDRGKRGQAIKQMVADVQAGRALPGQLIIYPQGTRIAPGVKAPYKIGTGALYRELGQPVVPVATNVGVFWPKRAIYRRQGTAVFEFLPRIAPGLEIADFMHRLETDIETASDRLAAEAGFPLRGL